LLVLQLDREWNKKLFNSIHAIHVMLLNLKGT